MSVAAWGRGERVEWRGLGGQQRWGQRRRFEEGVGEEAQVSSRAPVSLALSTGQSLGIGVPETIGEGAPFSRNSSMPTSSHPHQIPSCLASDMHSLGMTELFKVRAGLWHLLPRPQGLWPEHHGVAVWGAGLGQGLIQFHFPLSSSACETSSSRHDISRQSVVGLRLPGETWLETPLI